MAPKIRSTNCRTGKRPPAHGSLTPAARFLQVSHLSSQALLHKAQPAPNPSIQGLLCTSSLPSGGCSAPCPLWSEQGEAGTAFHNDRRAETAFIASSRLMLLRRPCSLEPWGKAASEQRDQEGGRAQAPGGDGLLPLTVTSLPLVSTDAHLTEGFSDPTRGSPI